MSLGIEIIDRRKRPFDEDEIVAAVKTVPRPGVIYFLGGCDTGKTNIVKQLSGILGSTFSCGYLDADPGQSEIGPPSTIGLDAAKLLPEKTALEESRSRQEEAQPRGLPALRFIGTTSPSYNSGPALDSLPLLSRMGTERFDYLFVDSSGYISGEDGLGFQLRSVQAAGTGLVIAIEKDNELEHIPDRMAAKNNPPAGKKAVRKVLRISPAGAVRTKTQAERRENRALKFRSYFASAGIQKISLGGRRILGKVPDLSNPDDYRNLLCAVCGEKLLVLSLVLIKGYDPNRECLILTAPPFQAKEADTIIFGRLYVNGKTGKELGKR